MNQKRIQRKAIISIKECVACGSCVKVCPLQAITIWKGISARVNEKRCVGCGKCALECPASIITIQEEKE